MIKTYNLQIQYKNDIINSELIMSEVLKSWTIVQFKPNAHKYAERNLNQQGFKTFLPFEKITKYKNQKFTFAKRPLFPGYMFVIFDKRNMDWHKINNTYGVSKVLTSNNMPYLLPDTFINKMVSQCNQSGVFFPNKNFSKGDLVQIISGPFDNFLATVESIDKNQRVWILIELMGQSTRALVKAEKLNYAAN